MAENAVLIDIIPDDPEANMDEILQQVKEKLPKECGLKDHKVEPYVFGLKKLKIMLIIPEQEGILDKIEDTLSSIDGIDVEIVSVTRI